MDQSENQILLEAIDIHKSFGQPQPIQILKGFNLRVLAGESIAIIGRSGEGKSTLLQILGTLDQPSRGRLRVGNQEVNAFNKASIRNQQIGFVFQSFYLLEDYTALENVLMPARIARQDIGKGSPAYKRGLSLLEKVGLSQRSSFHTKFLSGGEKQRVALARAMCNNPSLILADEPSGNLDRQTSHLIHEILLGFARDSQKGIIIVTHDRELASLCSKVYELKDGLLHPA